jgi:AraC family transcriptional regulator
MEGQQKHIAEPFMSFLGKEELLAKVIDCFPYPIEVYDPNGTTVLVNKAILAEYHVSDPGMVIGKYNIFEDPAVVCSGQLHMVKRAFGGKSYFFMMLKYLWKKFCSGMA